MRHAIPAPSHGPGRTPSAWRARYWAPLILADLAFMAMHVLSALRMVEDPRWRVDVDLGHAEWWQYLKATAVTVALATAFASSRQRIYLAWAAVYGFVVLDDALSIHEFGGVALAALLGLPEAFGLRAVDLGELLTWAVAGIPLLAFGVRAHRRSDATARARSLRLLGWFALLVFFGLVVDMLHSILAQAALPLRGLSVLEDGGEMIVMSLTAVYASHLPRHAAAPGSTVGRPH